MFNKLRRLLAKILFPNSYDSKAFVRYLIKKGASIGENTRFIAPRQCQVDVNRASYITIGCNCCLSFVTLLAHDYSWYVFEAVYKDILPDPGGKIVIGNNCFVGYQACILKDTIIGDNVIIGARSVVKGYVPSNTVWAGVPARQICTLDELYEKRANNRMEDAFKRLNYIREFTNKEANLSDMGMFAFLFLDRTEENYEKYIKEIEFNGINDNPKIKEDFFSSKPQIDYLDFLNYQQKM